MPLPYLRLRLRLLHPEAGAYARLDANRHSHAGAAYAQVHAADRDTGPAYTYPHTPDTQADSFDLYPRASHTHAGAAYVHTGTTHAHPYAGTRALRPESHGNRFRT